MRNPTRPLAFPLLGHHDASEHVRVNVAMVLEHPCLGEEEHEGLTFCNGIGGVEDPCITGNRMRGVTHVGPDDLRPYLNVQCARLK